MVPSRNPFPKPITNSSPSILCSNCEENQQKIIQLLHSFEPITTRKSVDHHKQYELYAAKLESRYPLCATCSFRVAAQLKRCEEEAGLEERRKTASSGGGWQNKLKLAQEMRKIQIFRRVIKGIFYWPDFLFQLGLIVMSVFRMHNDSQINCKYSFNLWSEKFKFWLPFNEINFSSCFFVLSSVLFLLQFNGIAVNRRGILALIPQITLFALRGFIGNYLFRNSVLNDQIDLNFILSIAAVGQAIIVKVGSKNSIIPLANRKVFSVNSVNYSNFNDSANMNVAIFSKSPAQNRNSDPINSSKKKGFAAYSDRHHQYYSFANQGENQKIMPWPEEPLPGKLNSALKDENRNFDMKNFFNQANNTCNQDSNIHFKPTRLACEDSLELEPMFSSFSLSDDLPKVTRRSKVIPPRETSKNSSFGSNKSEGSNELYNRDFNGDLLKDSQQYRKMISLFDAEMLKIAYNSLLTALLAVFRFSLQTQASLITIVLALTFGLRGFLWPRLQLKFQLIALICAVGRLLWLAAELQGKIVSGRFGHLAMAIDLILIILR